MLAGLFACLFAWLLLGSAEPPPTATSTAAGTARRLLRLRARTRPQPIDGTAIRAACSTLDSLCADRARAASQGSARRRARRSTSSADVDLNPLDDLGSVIAKAAADAWTAAMMAIWASGLFVLRIVLTFSEAFPHPRPGD